MQDPHDARKESIEDGMIAQAEEVAETTTNLRRKIRKLQADNTTLRQWSEKWAAECQELKCRIIEMETMNVQNNPKEICPDKNQSVTTKLV